MTITGLSRGDIIWAVSATGAFTFSSFMLVWYYVYRINEKIDDLTNAVDYLVRRQKNQDALNRISDKVRIYKPLVRALEGTKDEG